MNDESATEDTPDHKLTSDAESRYVKSLNDLIFKSGGIKKFCDKNSLSKSVVYLVTTKKRSPTAEFIAKVSSLTGLMPAGANQETLAVINESRQVIRRKKLLKIIMFGAALSSFVSEHRLDYRAIRSYLVESEPFDTLQAGLIAAKLGLSHDFFEVTDPEILECDPNALSDLKITLRSRTDPEEIKQRTVVSRGPKAKNIDVEAIRVQAIKKEIANESARNKKAKYDEVVAVRLYAKELAKILVDQSKAGGVTMKDLERIHAYLVLAKVGTEAP